MRESEELKDKMFEMVAYVMPENTLVEVVDNYAKTFTLIATEFAQSQNNVSDEVEFLKDFKGWINSGASKNDLKTLINQRVSKLSKESVKEESREGVCKTIYKTK